MAAVAEVTLPNGRRADVLAFDGAGTIWIVEVKSGPPDFQADQKWPEYRDWCDAFHFAVAADFPLDVLPADCGLFVGDGYGADLLRPAPVARLAPARRRALLLLRRPPGAPSAATRAAAAAMPCAHFSAPPA
jgi:hypothetical protein